MKNQMKKIIYKVLIYKKPKNIVDEFFKLVLGFGVSKYWIEYRIDENRFWFVKEFLFKIVSNHNTKNNKEKAFSIIDGIIERSYLFGYEHIIVIDDRNNTNLPNSIDENQLTKQNKPQPSLFLKKDF